MNTKLVEPQTARREIEFSRLSASNRNLPITAVAAYDYTAAVWRPDHVSLHPFARCEPHQFAGLASRDRHQHYCRSLTTRLVKSGREIAPVRRHVRSRHT